MKNIYLAARRIYDPATTNLRHMLWDDNGNLAQQTLYSVNNNVPTFLNMRMLFWDEDDRLNLVAGDGYLSYYAYGHDGNRAIKMTGTATIDPNGTLINTGDLNNITIYPNEYLSVTQAEYTKYYYAGGNRIASKIGTGGLGKMTRLCTLDQNLTANANTLFDNVLQHTVNTTSQPTDEYPVNTCGGYNVATELLTSPLLDFYISQTNLNFTQNNLLQQFRQNLAGGTEAVYYFHSDHLGSASWITNNTGLPVQHLLYLPFGEYFANEHSSGYDERFTFTGKERDAETGYYYHGARFNSSDIGWLSVDPMADKYPSLTPYNYCAWNPIKLVDPEGREFDFESLYYVEEFKKFVNIYVISHPRMTIIDRTEINIALGELQKLEESNQKYHITEGGIEKNFLGKTTYDVENNRVNIAIKDSKDFSTLAHELKHAYQFETGELSFSASNGEGGILYDKYDENEAMQRGVTFGGKNSINRYTFTEDQLVRKSVNSIADPKLPTIGGFYYYQLLGKENLFDAPQIFRFNNKTFLTRTIISNEK